MKPIKIVYFGTPEFSSFVLEQLINHFKNISDPKFEIQAIITRSDKPVGREKIVKASEVARVGEKYNIPVLKPKKLTPEFITENLSYLKADIFIVVAYGKIIPNQLLNIPKLGALNIHPSLLPKYRGASPMQEAILHGDQTSGVTIMLMNEKMDEGPILKQERIDLSSMDTYESLSKKLFQHAVPLLISVLEDLIQNKVNPTAQDESQATYCRERQQSTLVTKEDGHFDINTPPSPEILGRRIRAYYPWPGVWTKWNERIVKFFPGGLVQIEGKNKVPLKDFLNGYPSFPIKTL